MLRGKRIRRIFSGLLLLLAVWVATPKSLVHALLGHDHCQVISASSEISVSQSSQDCDFEQYNKPVYFNLFEFICSFVPEKREEPSRIFSESFIIRLSSAISLLRGPPASN